MAAANPYQLDPLLAQGFSNLTRALVGDPQSDVYGARADLLRQQIEQSKASGRQSDAAANASSALARLRAAEAVGETVKSDRMAALFAQVSPDNVHPLAETAFMNSMGFDGTIDEIGNVVKSIRPGGPLMSEPMRGSQDGHILTRTGMGTDTLMSLLVGDGTYEPDSMSNALTNLGEGRLSAMAKSMILNGTPDQQAAGMKMLFPQGSEYQDLGAVASRLAQTIAGDVDIQKLVNEALIATNAADNTQSGLNNAADNTRAVTTNTADNARAVTTNTADNTQSGANNAADNSTKITISSNTDASNESIAAAGGGSSDVIKITESDDRALNLAVDQAMTAQGYDTDPENFPDKALAWFRNEVKSGPVLRFQRHENITQAKDEVTNSVGRPIKIDTNAFYDEVVFNNTILGLVESIMTDLPNIQEGIEQSSAMRALTEGLGYNEKQAGNIIDYYLKSLVPQGG